MGFIDHQKELFDQLIELYNDQSFLDKLAYKRERILSVFEQIFDEEASNFKLVYNDSIQKGKYYKIESRIKKADSLREKFYRRNIGLELIRDLKLNEENIQEKNVQRKIHERYNLLDDIIGIRIVTELKADCISALSLIENRISLFNQGGIFFSTDFRTQPTKMENGLEIIKLKGVYGGKNAFELQIKSKIDSAWGDMDHKLFYKNYSSTPIKDTLQVSMNNIGELLNHIEKFLYDLRETNNKEDESIYDQRLVDYLFEVIGPEIDRKLEIRYDLKRILDPILFFCTELNLSENMGSIDFSYFEKVRDFSEYRAYRVIRKYNFDYVLLETLFFNCLVTAQYQETLEIDYKQELKHYFVLLSKYLEKKIKDSDVKLEKNYYKVIFKKMMTLLNHVEDPGILLDHGIYKKLRLIDKIIIDVIVENELDVKPSSISDLFTLFAFTKGKRIKNFVYDDDEDYIAILTKVKQQVEAMEQLDLLNFFNQVILNIAKDIEMKEGL